MKKNLMLLLFPLLPGLSSKAQLPRKPLAAAYLEVGAYSRNHVDVFSTTANQAAQAQVKNGSAGIYGERKFLLAELSNYTLATALNTRSGNFGVRVNYSGFADHHEASLSAGYGRSLGNKLDVGAQVNYHMLNLSNDYGNASAIGFEIGTIYHISEKLHTGFHVSNPVAGKFGKNSDEKLAAVYSFGIGFDASDRSLVSITIEKEEDQPVNINAGILYQFSQRMQVRLGISSATSSPWMGIGFSVRSFRVDVITTYHPQLGLTPGLLLVTQFNRK